MKILLLTSFFFSCAMTTTLAQEIFKIPVTQKKSNIQWQNEESTFFSKVWQTQVVTNVSEATMEIFRPVKGTSNGTAVVVCPGGGLYAHSINSEGNDVAKWLAQRGVTAFVLKYRLVPTGENGVADLNSDGAKVVPKAKEVLPLSVSDALNAIEYIRTNATDLNINPNRIGLMGFSAGGAVTMGATFAYESKNRPDFIAPVYAWMNVIASYTVPSDAPPMFVVCASDDPLNLAPASIELYTAWLKAKKSTELHMYAKGGHGFGMKTQNLPTDNWIKRFGEWMNMQGWMESEKGE